MKRRGSHRPAITIALFPFLAVLICTMGVIIVMLVLVVRQATQRAQEEVAHAAAAKSQQAESAAARLAAAERQQKEEVEDLEWQRDILAKQREERREELTNLRQRVAHVEDHLRRLQAEAQTLLAQARDVDDGKQLKDSELKATREQLQAIQAQIAKTEEEHAALKAKLQASQRWFALIPYDGPHGTRRRPIYIECSEVGVVLQPEGLTLLPDDFNGPLGPGNPLDAALRAKREFMERAGEQGLPYPLLVVRPDGIVAYMAARSALKSWDEEFGYELIDAEKQLLYGKADPAFAQTLENIVRQARRRQAQLAAAMPRKFSQEDTLNSFRTAEVMSDSAEMAMAAGRGVGGNRLAGTGSSTGISGRGGTGPSGTTSGGTGTGSGTGTSSGGGGQQLAAGSQALRGNSTAGSSTYPNGLRSGTTTNGTNGNTTGAGTAGGVAGGPNSSGGTSGSAGSISGGSAGGPTTPQGAEATAGGSPSVNMTYGQTNPTSANKRRSQNWGLPNAAGRSVAVTRPIRVECQNDRLVVYPERGDIATPSNVHLQDSDIAPQEIDALVAAVQKRIQSWGIAAQNGYWKPVLTVEVAPNAQQRFEQLETALRGSGYDIQRKTR